MVDVWDLHREFGDRDPYPENMDKARSQNRNRSGGQRPAGVRKVPLAAPWSSEIAEDWMQRANDHGFEPPFNANYLASDLEVRASRDPYIRLLREHEREEDVHRLLVKMVELFWQTDAEDGFTYVRASDTAGKVKDIFLVEVWDDLRQYAYDSLRARYLKEHGRARPAPQYANHEQTEMHEALRKVRERDYLAREMQARAEQRELHRLDEHTRQVLSSAQERKKDS